MPILYRYLLSQYLKVHLLCVVSFIAILLTTRLQEIAQFATLGAQGWLILQFTLYQIPYILPIAIPIACLISSIVLIQRLSASHELTALRASGKSFINILAPILYAAVAFSILNFYIVSELATASHLATRKLEYELRTINPLVLLQNKHLSKLKGIYATTLGSTQAGEKARDLVVAVWNTDSSRIDFMAAQELLVTGGQLNADRLTLIAPFGGENGQKYDNLVIENVQNSTSSSEEFSQLLKRHTWKIHNDYLKMSLLLTHIQHMSQRLAETKQEGLPTKSIKRQLEKSYSDIVRRISIAMAAFTFTLMGATFSIHIGRQQTHRGLFTLIALATVYLVAFFSAKRFEDHAWLASCLYLIPHILIIIFSIRALQKVTRGVE